MARYSELTRDLEKAKKDNNTVEIDLLNTQIENLRKQMLQVLNNLDKLPKRIDGRLKTAYSS